MRRQLILLAAVIVAAGCVARKAPPAPQPGPVRSSVPIGSASASAASLVDHEGDSPETAVHVPADAPNDGIDFQNNWIYDRYGRFRRAKWGIAHAGEGNTQRRYEVVTIELTDHSQRTLYFDITENWAAWQPSSKK